MRLAAVQGAVLDGVQAQLIDVQTQLGNGLPVMSIVGLPDTAVSESRERIRAAVGSSGFTWPDRRLTVALLPSDRRKRGPGLDVPIAASVLAVAGHLPAESLQGVVLIGEVALDGTVRTVSGLFPRVLAALRAGAKVGVPFEGLTEAALARTAMMNEGAEPPQVFGIHDLGHLTAVLRGDLRPPEEPERATTAPNDDGPDMADIAGQATARKALEVAAAGGHHLLMVGPPGVGKTMLASRLPTLLPDLADNEITEVAGVRSILAGEPMRFLPCSRPFVAPHHTASASALIGGGSAGQIRPGLVTAAHRGVLFLDEAPEFDRRSLQALRQPLETGHLAIHRSHGAAYLPAKFQLVMAANPCPCGHYTADGAACSCPVAARLRYFGKLRGPLLDRIDLAATLTRPSISELAGGMPGESTQTIRGRVAAARSRMRRRLAGSGLQHNADLPADWLKNFAEQHRDLVVPLFRLVDRGVLSVRAVHRVLRVAWTLADLAELSAPGSEQVASALAMRVPARWR